MKQQINLLLQVIQQNVNEKSVIKAKQSTISHQQNFISNMCLYLIKFYGNFYKYHKAFINYKERFFKKAANIMSHHYSIKLNVVSKDTSVINSLYQLY